MGGRMSKVTKRSNRGPAPLILFVVIALLFYRFGEHWLRLLLLYLSGAGWARRIVTDFPLAWRVASRFVAGETVEDAVIATRRLNEEGMTIIQVTHSEKNAAYGDRIIKLVDGALVSDVQTERAEIS